MASLIRLRGRELWRVRAQDGGGAEQNGREKERGRERERWIRRDYKASFRLLYRRRRLIHLDGCKVLGGEGRLETGVEAISIRAFMRNPYCE